MTDQNISINIKATSSTATKSLDEVAAGIKKIETAAGGATAASDKFTSSSRTMETATASVTSSINGQIAIVRQLAAAYGLYKIAEYIKDATMLAARYETLGVVMRVVGNNSGYTGTQMEAFAKGLEKTGISMIEARQSLTRMVQANLDLAQSSKLARVAQDAAVIGNINSSEAFQRMVYGIQSGQVEILRTIGINVNFENSYQKVAKASGRVAAQLSEAEKSQIRMNVVMDAGKLIAGTYEAAMGTAGKQVFSLQRHIDNMKVAIGLAFTPALAEIIETITGAIIGLNGELSGNSKDKITAWGENFRLVIMKVELSIADTLVKFGKLRELLYMANMGLSAIPAAMGNKGSQQRFGAAAQGIIDIENETKARDALIKKIAEYEKAITPAGKAAAAAAKLVKEAEDITRTVKEKGTAVDEKAIAAAKKLREEWEKTRQSLDKESRLAGLEGARKEFEANLIEVETLKKHFEALPPALRKIAYAQIEENKANKDAAVIQKAVADSREDNAKAMEKERKEIEELVNKMAALEESYSPVLAAQNKYLRQVRDIKEALDKQVIKPAKATELTTLAGFEKDSSIAKYYADYYATIEGYEQKAYDKKIELINLEKNARIFAAEESMKAVGEMYKKGLASAEEFGAVYTKAAETIAAANTKASQDQQKAFSDKIDAEQKWAKTAIANATSVLDAALTCYAEDSYEYNRIQEWKRVLMVAELAMNAAKNAQIIASNLGLVASNTGVAVSNAGAAVTGASIGVGPTGFATAAAMIALMASVFAMYGIAAGGGASASAPSTPAKPKSTVLGAADGTASESISKSWELMQETYDMESTKLTQIYNALKDLSNSIIGLVASIFRTGGMDMEGIDLSETQGMQNKFWSDFGRYMLGDFNDTFKKIRMIGLDFGGFIVDWLVGGLINGIFGGDKSQELMKGGIEIGDVIIKNIMAGAQIKARQFAYIKTTTDGGWFGSDSEDYRTEYRDLDESVIKMLTTVFNNIGSGLLELAKGLGTDVQKVYDYVFKTSQINLQGMDAEEMSKALNDYFSGIADQAADDLFGAIIKDYQRVSEGLFETAVRLVQDKAIVESVLKLTGQSFEGTIPQVIKFSESLIELAGGLEALTDAASTYYDKFYTDAEKQARIKESMGDVFKENKIVGGVPDTREAYRKLLEGLDLTTESGKEAYLILLKLSESADAYYSYLEEVANKRADLEMQVLELTGTAAEVLAAQRKKELDAMDETLRPLQELIWLTQDWADKIAEATSNTTSAIDEQINLSKTASSAARSAADAYKKMINTLTDAQIKINGGGATGAQGRFDTIFSKAMTGDRESLAALPESIDGLLANSLKTSQTAEDYARDQGKALLALEQAKVISGAMVNWEEYQATLLETQTTVLEQIKDELAKPSPDLILLEKQAGLLDTIGTLLAQQVVQIAQGNSDQILLMHDQTGQIVQANVLTRDQTGQIIIGNSWLAGNIDDVTKTINAGVKIAEAEAINGYLNTAANFLASNNSTEARAAKEAIELLRQTTADGLISSTEAAPTKAAVLTLQNATTDILAKQVLADIDGRRIDVIHQGILETNQMTAISQNAYNAAQAVQATQGVESRIASGININSATEIQGYLKSVELGLKGNNSAEAQAARAAMETLRQTTRDGLITASEATKTTEALAVLRNSTAALLSQAVEVDRGLMSAQAIQANEALQASLRVATTVGAAASNVTTTIGGQTAEIINGNLIIKDQSGLILSGNKLITDQTGKITIGNALTDQQTAQVATGVAIQDAIKNISELNQNFTKEMLASLIDTGSVQNNSLQSILEANNKTVALIRTLIQLTIQGDKEKMQAVIKGAQSDYLVALDKMNKDQMAYSTAKGNLWDAEAKKVVEEAKLEKAKQDLIVKQKAYDDAPTTKTYTSSWGVTLSEQDFKAFVESMKGSEMEYLAQGWTENIFKDAAITKALADAKALVETSKTAVATATAAVTAAAASVAPLYDAFRKSMDAYEAAMWRVNELTEAFWKKYPDERPIAWPNEPDNPHERAYPTYSFASGGIFTNGIVSQPTMFHNSQMGEAGSEAIMPLVRGPQGLGVRSSGGDNVILIEEIRALKAEAKEQNNRLARIEKTNKTTADVLQRVTRDGESMLTEAS